MDLRKPKELKRGNQWLALFYASGGIYGGLRGGKGRRGYAHPPPIRQTITAGAVKGAISKGCEGMTGGGEESIYLDHLECGGFGRGKCSDIPKSITAL